MLRIKNSSSSFGLSCPTSLFATDQPQYIAEDSRATSPSHRQASHTILCYQAWPSVWNLYSSHGSIAAPRVSQEGSPAVKQHVCAVCTTPVCPPRHLARVHNFAMLQDISSLPTALAKASA